MHGMILPTEVDTLDHFKRQSRAEIRKLKRSGRPKVLTVNGKPAVIVQDAAAYEAQMRLLDEIDCVAAVREGAADADAGRLVDAVAFVRQLRREPLPRKR
jgi:PHD/YefM family antitoxin component YafN of YafNO toxin-antitoxin module